jgi:hypothetical protein
MYVAERSIPHLTHNVEKGGQNKLQKISSKKLRKGSQMVRTRGYVTDNKRNKKDFYAWGELI